MRITNTEDQKWLSAHADELPPSYCRPQLVDIVVASAVQALLDEETPVRSRNSGLAELESNANL
jgi:hypothetical protein